MNLSRSAQFHMKTRVCLNNFVNEGLWKQFFTSNLKDLFKFNLFDTSFNLKLDELIFKKALKSVVLDNYFLDLFSEVQIWY